MKRQWVILSVWLGIMALVLGTTTRKKLKPSQLEPLWPVPAVEFVGVTAASSGATGEAMKQSTLDWLVMLALFGILCIAVVSVALAAARL
jgi:hypothetical protein